MRKLLNPEECQGKVVESVSDDFGVFAIHFDDGSTLMLQSELDGHCSSEIYYRLFRTISEPDCDTLSYMKIGGVVTGQEYDAEYDRRRQTSMIGDKAGRYRQLLDLLDEFDPESRAKYPSSFNTDTATV